LVLIRKRSLYGPVTAAAAVVVLSSGVGWWACLSSQRPALTGVCALTAVLGAAWMWWYWHRTALLITSIAEQLEDGLAVTADRASGGLAGRLADAVNGRFAAGADCVNQLQKQLKDLQIQNRLLEGQKRQTEEIIYSIRDAVIVVDEFDKLLMANEAAAGLFNFDFKKDSLKPVDELIDDSKKEFTNFLRHSRQSKVRGNRKQISFEHNGANKTFDCIVSCVLDENKRACGTVAVLHDITREKELSRMKNDFVSHVSHELKTPLASITAYSEMLADGEAGDEETRKQFYSVIQNQAGRLNRLIEDILNVSRIESGLMKVDKQHVSLTILIEQQLQMIRKYAEEKNIELISEKPIVFDQVYVDKDMISQVIINLLSNAVKYTKPGGKVTLRSRVDDAEGKVRVTVADTGVGIPPDEIGHVFDKFYRVSANKTQAKGTGLGLNLVKQIVEKVHNGRVFVESEVGLGSTFGFELDLANRQMVTA